MKHVTSGEIYATWRYNKALEENKILKQKINILENELAITSQLLQEKREVNEHLLSQISYLFSKYNKHD